MSEQVHILGGIFRDFIFYGKVHASSILEIPGGTGYNVYKGLIELGIDVGFSGSVGLDWPFEPIGKKVNAKTGIFVSRESHNKVETIAVYRGANLLTAFEGGFGSHVLFASLECGGETFKEYASYAKQKGGLVILDPSPVFEWRREYIELCDVILPNKAEYETIFDRPGNIPRNIEIFEKMGEEGGIYIRNGTSYHFQLHKKGRFPLGCGDAFDVAVLYGILKHHSPKEILKKAVYAGSSASLIKGSSTAVVKAAEKIA